MLHYSKAEPKKQNPPKTNEMKCAHPQQKFPITFLNKMLNLP